MLLEFGSDLSLVVGDLVFEFLNKELANIAARDGLLCVDSESQHTQAQECKDDDLHYIKKFVDDVVVFFMKGDSFLEAKGIQSRTGWIAKRFEASRVTKADGCELLVGNNDVVYNNIVQLAKL